MSRSNRSNASNTSNSEPQWVSCIAKADFWGDAGASQLSLRKNNRLEVDVQRTSKNGWRWGRCGRRSGWFPEWAVPVLPPHELDEDSRARKGNNSIKKKNKRSVPARTRSMPVRRHSSRGLGRTLGPKLSADDLDNGFNLEKNNILGGSPGSERTAETSSNSSHQTAETSSTSSSSTGSRVLSISHDGTVKYHNSFPSNFKWGALKRETKGGRNPYRQNQKQPDWDGSEVPQIVSGVDGSVTVLETNGDATRHINEKSYKLSEFGNRVSDQLGIERKPSGFRSPTVSKGRRRGSVGCETPSRSLFESFPSTPTFARGR